MHQGQRCQGTVLQHGFVWLASLSATKQNCPLPFPQRKALTWEHSTVPQSHTEPLEAASFHPAGARLPQVPQSRERAGEARAVAISAALAAASADNEKPFCLAAIKPLPFHERNPEFFLKPKQKSEPFIRFIII